jgi:hypothetical protein
MNTETKLASPSHLLTRRSTRNSKDLFDSEIEQLFEDVLQRGDVGFRQEQTMHLQATSGVICMETQDLFCEIAAGYSKPLKDFLFELNRGSARKEWVEYCRPSLRAILKGAKQVQFPADSLEVMEMMDEQLAQAENISQHFLTRDLQQKILLAYARLEERIPKIFRRDSSSHLREKIIVESLLFQVPGVGKKTMQRLCSVGLTSLQTYSLVNVFDLSSTTGIPLLRCRQICLTFREHFSWIESIPPEKHDQRLLNKLGDLSSHLGIWKRKKRAKKSDKLTLHLTPTTPLLHTLHNKKLTLLQIRLILAELNQLELLHRLEGKKISQVIYHLNNFLASSAPSAESRKVNS